MLLAFILSTRWRAINLRFSDLFSLMTWDTWCPFQRDSSRGTYQPLIYNVTLIQASKVSCSNWFWAPIINGRRPTPTTTNQSCWICCRASSWSSIILSPNPNRSRACFFSIKSKRTSTKHSLNYSHVRFLSVFTSTVNANGLDSIWGANFWIKRRHPILTMNGRFYVWVYGPSI